MSEAFTALEPDASLAERAYEELSRLVLTRKLPGGSLVVEGRLAQQLDISRTPMREAILRLAAEGLLVKQGSRSYAVRRVHPVEFFQALKVRELLEGEAVELAIGRIPRETIDALPRAGADARPPRRCRMPRTGTRTTSCICYFPRR